MRSSPAKASLICVPISAMLISGIATNPVKKMYITKSPRVIVPARIARPPTMIIRTLIMPMIAVANAPMAEIPVTAFATRRSRRCAPRANTRASPRSAT